MWIMAWIHAPPPVDVLADKPRMGLSALREEIYDKVVLADAECYAEHLGKCLDAGVSPWRILGLRQYIMDLALRGRILPREGILDEFSGGGDVQLKWTEYDEAKLAKKVCHYEGCMYDGVESDKSFLFQRRYVKPYLDILRGISPRGIENHEQVLRQLYAPNRLDVCRLVVVLGTKCSLRCRACNNLMPLFRPQTDMKKDVLMESLHNFFALADSVVRCELIGGEPFLSENLHEALAFVVAQPQIRQVELTTNATVLPRADLVPLLQQDKVLVRVSDYGKLGKKEMMMAFLQKHNIRYEVLGISDWWDSGGTWARNMPLRELVRGYFRCSPGYNCTTLYEGKLYECARSASLHALGMMSAEEALLLNGDTTKGDVRDFLLRHYSLACDHCDIALEKPKKIPPAVQLK